MSLKLRNNESKIISGALFVPNLNANLLSVSKMVAKGYELFFDKNGCKILDNDCVIATANEFSGIYILDVKKEACSIAYNALKTKNNTFSLWHRRLGHLNKVSMNLLKKVWLQVLCLTMRLRLLYSLFGRKILQKPFMSGKSKRAKMKLELVHAD